MGSTAAGSTRVSVDHPFEDRLRLHGRVHLLVNDGLLAMGQNEAGDLLDLILSRLLVGADRVKERYPVQQ